MSSVSCSSKLVEPEEGVLGASHLQLVGQKHQRLVTGSQVGASCGAEHLSAGSDAITGQPVLEL